MADLQKYVPWAVEFGSTSIPFTNLTLLNENLEEEVRSDGAVYPELVATLRKNPIVRMTLLDPSLVTDFQAVQTGATYESVKLFWRAVTEEGGPTGAYISATIVSGALFPVSLQSNFEGVATMDIECRVRYNAGTGITLGTDSGTQSDTNVAYRATSLVIGSDTVVNIQSVSASWNFNLIQEEMLEPDHYGYDQVNLDGSAELSDLALVDIGRLQDGAEETVTLTLGDLETPANTTQVSFGNSFVKAQFTGRTAAFSWRKLTA